MKYKKNEKVIANEMHLKKDCKWGKYNENIHIHVIVVN